MIKVLLSGVNGRLGQTLVSYIGQTEDMVVVAGVDKMPRAHENPFPVYEDFTHVIESVDVIIDFSRPDALSGLLTFAQEKNAACVLATTGYSANDKMMIVKYAGHIPVFFSANMSLGVNLQMELAKKAAEFLGNDFDIEIVEKHHNQKVDAPSGTALAIADYINTAFMNTKEYVYGRTPKVRAKREQKEIGIHAVRGGTIVGQHDVLFIGNDEIIEVHHTALSRNIFAEGAIRAAKFLSGKPAGLYSMFDIISEVGATMSLYTEENTAVLCVNCTPGSPSSLSAIFDALSKGNVEIDLVQQCFLTDDTLALSFCVAAEELQRALSILKTLKDVKASAEHGLTKFTLEGRSMLTHSNVTAKLFKALSSEQIKTYLFSASATKISFCIGKDDTTKAVKAITEAFKL